MLFARSPRRRRANNADDDEILLRSKAEGEAELIIDPRSIDRSNPHTVDQIEAAPIEIDGPFGPDVWTPDWTKTPGLLLERASGHR